VVGGEYQRSKLTNLRGHNRTMTRVRIPKRELSFDTKIKRFNDKWINYNDYLVLKDPNYGAAEKWKPQIYNMQHEASLALTYSFSNQHSHCGHRIIRVKGQVVIHPQIIMKAFYLRYCILLLQGCGDKLSQLVRTALGITKLKKLKKGKIVEDKATEKNINLKKIKTSLELTLNANLSEKERKILNEMKKYLEDEAVKKIIVESANTIKHRWQLFFQGEGLQPIKPETYEIRDGKGSVIGKQLPECGYTMGENIEEYIRLCLQTNNMFVNMANAILEQLNFEQFYVVEDGRRLLKF
jgi:hypothetical protein